MNFDEAFSSNNKIYIIEISGEINKAVYQHMKDSINEIEARGDADLIVFDIETYGGRVDAAESMSDMILSLNTPTMSYVNSRAISAGVLLTISSDMIVMKPGSTIGSAETIPNTEKIMSMWKSTLRSAAQETGRDPLIAEAMADENIVIEGVTERGSLLNLTSQEALDLEFIDLVESDIKRAAEELGFENAELVNYDMPFMARFSQFITGSFMAPLLLTLGFIGLVLEILTPGFGLGIIVSLSSFGLYFLGSIMAGASSILALLIFIIGIVFLFIELTMPGLGIPGVIGIVSIITSIGMASSNPVQAVIYVFFMILIVLIIFLVMLKVGPNKKMFDKITLKNSMLKETGYSSTDNYEEYIGQEGIVKSYLRPSGTIEVNGRLLDVVSEGSIYIEYGKKVKVIKVEGRKILVREVN